MLVLEKQLQAQITAQSLMIEALLETTLQAGALDVRRLVERLERYVEAPKAEGIDPGTAALLAGEVNAWADMIFDLYGDQAAARRRG